MAANHVFHFDRWWNPAEENQATDRAFRIGQKKECPCPQICKPRNTRRKENRSTNRREKSTRRKCHKYRRKRSDRIVYKRTERDPIAKEKDVLEKKTVIAVLLQWIHHIKLNSLL